MCQKMGHLTRVCESRKKKSDTTFKASSKKTDVHHEQKSHSDSDSSTDSAMHSLFQLGGSDSKFLVFACVNGVDIDMKVDTGVECTKIPWSHFN